MELSKKYGPVYTLYMGPKPAVVLCGYQAVKEALVDQAEKFSGRAELPIVDLTSQGYGIAFSNGERWKELRRFSLTTLRNFGMGKRSIEERIQEEIHFLLEIFQNTQGSFFSPAFFIRRSVSNVICSVIFGKRFDYTDQKLQTLLDLVAENLRRVDNIWVQLYNFIPSLLKLVPGPHHKLTENYTAQLQYVEEIVQEHEATLDPSSPRDYVDAFLIKMQQESKNPHTEFHIRNLLTSALDIFFAGQETTSSTLGGLLILMKYPHIKEKVQAEIEDVIGRFRQPCMEDRSKMPYTEAVIHEIMRFIDFLPLGAPRSVTEDTLFRGYTIPKGTTILTVLHSVLFDSSMFEQPQEFDPGHFMEKDGSFKKNDGFMAFSAGKRSCPGESLARMELFLYLTSILQRFDLRPSVDPNHIDLSPEYSGFGKMAPTFQLGLIPYCPIESNQNILSECAAGNDAAGCQWQPGCAVLAPCKRKDYLIGSDVFELDVLIPDESRIATETMVEEEHDGQNFSTTWSYSLTSDWEHAADQTKSIPAVTSEDFRFQVISSSLEIQPANIYFGELKEKHGSIYTIYLGARPAVILCGYKVVKEALVDQGEAFGARGKMALAEHILKGFGITGSNGERWKQLRRFSLTTLRNFGMGKRTIEKRIQEEAQFLVEELENTEGRPFDPTFFLSCAVSNIICSIVFGQRFDYKDERFLSLLNNINSALRFMNSTWGLIFFSFDKILCHFPGPHQQGMKHLSDLREFVQERVKESREILDLDAPQHFIDCFLIKMHEEQQNPETQFHMENLVVSAVNLFFAGTETVSTTLRYGILILIKHPDIQGKIQEEIDQVIGRQNCPKVEDRTKMPYTDAVIHEIQRFSDIVPTGLPHSASQDITFKGYTIPKGTDIFPLLTTVLKDPDQFPNPEEFRPDRFLDERGLVKKNQAFLPFSTGKRMCLGESLARMELFLFFTSLLQKFNLTSVVPSEDLDLTPDISSSGHLPRKYKLCVLPRQ
ncbi:LOW QUALITY PROTEIN: uncharacterized protein WCC33_015131 [Rhinophrynus dorsalis]